MSAMIHDAVSSTARSSWRATGARHHCEPAHGAPDEVPPPIGRRPEPLGPAPAIGAIRRLTVNFGGVPRLPGRDSAPSGASPSIPASPSTPGGRGSGPIPRAAPRRDRLRAGPRRGATGGRSRPRRVSETSDPPGSRGSDIDASGRPGGASTGSVGV